MNRNRLLSYTGYFLILLAGIIFSLSYIHVSIQKEQEKVHFGIERSIDEIKKTLEHEIYYAKSVVTNLHSIFLSMRETKLKTGVMVDIYRPYGAQMKYWPNQYNAYFLLNTQWSRELYNEEAYVITVNKNLKLKGTESYNDPKTFIETDYTDTEFLTSEEAVWWLAAQRSKDVEITDIYFDSLYMKEWMYSVVLGFYEGDKFQGMVGVDIILDAFLSTVENTPANEYGGLFLVNNIDGTVLTKRDEDQYNAIGAGERFKRNLKSVEGWTDLIGSNTIRKLKKGIDGNDYIVYSKTMQNFPWTIVGYYNPSIIYREAYQAGINLFIISMIVIALLIGLNYFIHQRLEKLNGHLLYNAKMVALGEMCGGVAHEVNNPLAIIHGHVVRLSKNLDEGIIDPENIRKSLTLIDKTVERIAKIIRGLKKISRESSGDPSEKVTARSIVSDSLSICRQRLINNSIELHFDEQQTALDSILCCQPVQISQVIVNLINNAHDAIKDSESPWIKLEVHKKEKYVEFSISDSGKGIPKEIRNRIFNPFFTTKPVGQGTGLGLSLSYSIIKNHGGELMIDHKAANTKFHFTLPV